MPHRSEVVFYDGCVWCFGGYTRKDGEYFNDVFRFDTRSKQWSPVRTSGDTPAKRTDHSVVLSRRA